MPSPSWRRAPTGPTAWYLVKRAKARAPRRADKINVPIKVGVPDNARKEDIKDLRRDILGPIIEGHLPVVPDQSRASLFSAFDKRCNYKSSQRVHPSVIRGSLDLLDKISPDAWDPLVHDRRLFEEWNAQFDSNKQSRHVKAYAQLAEITTKDFSDKQIFVKVEALLKRHDKNWAPRIIYQSSDLHNVCLGPVMWKCTKRMFSSMEYEQHDQGVRYLGAYSKESSQLVDFITRTPTSESMFVESDFSSNDMTQLEDVHLLEIRWLQRFGAPLWLTALMHVANKFKATSHKHKLKVQVENQLPTGAQSTTFRNSMWNASINYTWVKKHGLTGSVLLLGDDMLMRCDNIKWRKSSIRRSYEFVTKLAGMKAEVAVRHHLSECTFLSKQFLPFGSSFAMAPKYGKAVARFNVRATSNEGVSDEKYLAGKALSYAYEFRYVGPIKNLFILKFAELEVDAEAISLDGLGWNARGAFLRHGIGGVLEKVSSCPSVSRDEMTQFYYYKYSLTATDVIQLVHKLLFGVEDLDPVSMGFITSDWLD